MTVVGNLLGRMVESNYASEMKALIKLIEQLEGILSTDKKYEEFFVALDKVGLDEDVARAIDSSVGSKPREIENIVNRGLKDAERKEGTEPRSALDLAILSVEKLIKKFK